MANIQRGNHDERVKKHNREKDSKTIHDAAKRHSIKTANNRNEPEVNRLELECQPLVWSRLGLPYLLWAERVDLCYVVEEFVTIAQF